MADGKREDRCFRCTREKGGGKPWREQTREEKPDGRLRGKRRGGVREASLGKFKWGEEERGEV